MWVVVQVSYQCSQREPVQRRFMLWSAGESSAELLRLEKVVKYVVYNGGRLEWVLFSIGPNTPCRKCQKYGYFNMMCVEVCVE